jgi:transposase-like protein
LIEEADEQQKDDTAVQARVYEYIRGCKTHTELSDEYEVHPNQVKNWKSLLLKRAPDILDDRRKRRDG